MTKQILTTASQHAQTGRRYCQPSVTGLALGTSLGLCLIFLFASLLSGYRQHRQSGQLRNKASYTKASATKTNLLASTPLPLPTLHSYSYNTEKYNRLMSLRKKWLKAEEKMPLSTTTYNAKSLACKVLTLKLLASIQATLLYATVNRGISIKTIKHIENKAASTKPLLRKKHHACHYYRVKQHNTEQYNQNKYSPISSYNMFKASMCNSGKIV
jgi:hypothetical protein